MKTVPAEDELKFTYIVHTSLDVVEERINSSSTGRPSTGDMRELYLGLLYPTEDFKVYPFIINKHLQYSPSARKGAAASLFRVNIC